MLAVSTASKVVGAVMLAAFIVFVIYCFVDFFNPNSKNRKRDE